MHLSVVIPVYKGAATIGKVVDDCFAALSHLDFEIILVDDGSGDNTEETIFALAKKHANVKAISLAKNVGEFNAVMCGLNFATGEYTAIIDDDGQNPPAEILKLLAKAEQGHDVVYAKYQQKQHSWWRNTGSWLNNFLAWIFIGKPFGLYLSSFKVIHRSLLDNVLEISGGVGHIDSLLFCGPSKYGVEFVEHKKALISSRYNYVKLSGTSFSMLFTGKNSLIIMLCSLLLIPILFFFAVGNIMSDTPVNAYHIMLFNLFIALLFCNIIFFFITVVATIYFGLQRPLLRKEYKRIKKSF